jgi:hypothetical protein
MNNKVPIDKPIITTGKGDQKQIVTVTKIGTKGKILRPD